MAVADEAARRIGLARDADATGRGGGGLNAAAHGLHQAMRGQGIIGEGGIADPQHEGGGKGVTHRGRHR